MPTPLLTEADRRDCVRHAWHLVRRVNAPRAVRLLMRDKLAARVLADLAARRAKAMTATLTRLTTTL